MIVTTLRRCADDSLCKCCNCELYCEKNCVGVLKNAAADLAETAGGEGGNMKGYIESAFAEDTSKAERIRELLKADAEGRVAVLPCKVGDTVYEVTSRGTISEYEVMAIRIEMFGQFIAWRLRKGFVDRFCDGPPVGEVGKTVFLTREEAEKALEEMKDD